MSQPLVTWGYLVLTIFCAALIAAGFFFAGLQHFQTIDLGIRNADLRSEEEELRSEKRRLTLAREIALSPRELARTAKRLGFEEIGEPLQSLSVEAKLELRPPPKAVVIDVKSPDERTEQNTKAHVISKTALVKAVVPAKKSEPKTSQTVMAADKAADVKGDSRPRRIVEIRSGQSTTVSAQSGLK